MRIKRRNKPITKGDDFDFSRYEEEEQQEQRPEKMFTRTPVTMYRARFSQGQQMQDLIGYTQGMVSKYSVRVYAKSTTIKDYSDLYGSLSELWAQFCEIQGGIVNEAIDNQKKICEELVDAIETDKKKLDECRKELLTLKDKIYLIKQRSNLGIEVDRLAGGTRSSAINTLSQ